MAFKNWEKGYKEVKNVIHNDMGVSKEEICEVFRKIAQDEITKIISENKAFIYKAIQETIRHEMISAISTHRYPKVSGDMQIFGYRGRADNTFANYMSGVMKEEIIKTMREQFDIKFNIDKKD